MATTGVKAAFRPDIVILDIARLTPLKEITPAMRRDRKYSLIAASVMHVGLIEPIVVFPAGRGKYLVLDGHKRLEIVKAQGGTEVRCLLATDDECYTYNKRVNYLSPIAEHHMIMKALADGIPEETIAQSLDVNVAQIRKKRNLLDGICAEVAEVLKDKRVTAAAFSVLRKMKPARQIASAELMVAANKFTLAFAHALLSGTRPELRADEGRLRPQRRIEAPRKAVLEQETDRLLAEFKSVEESYGSDVLTLNVCCGYVKRLLANTRVQRYLSKRYPEIQQQLQQFLAEVQAEKTRPPKIPVKSATAPIKARRAAGA